VIESLKKKRHAVAKRCMRRLTVTADRNKSETRELSTPPLSLQVASRQRVGSMNTKDHLKFQSPSNGSAKRSIQPLKQITEIKPGQNVAVSFEEQAKMVKTALQPQGE